MGSYINHKVETPYDSVIVLVFGILTFLNVWLSIIFQEGRTCDWEWFEGRYELMLQLGRTKEHWKSRDTINRKLKIRKDYQVTLPLESFLSGPVLQDLRREYGKKTAEKATLDDCIVYWRRNRSKYPRPLTDRELLANYEKKKKQE